MSLQWTEKMAVGVEKIDTQHKELFNRINLFLDAMSKGKGKDEITKTLKFLEDYVDKHFREEEEIQIKSKYPRYNEQKAQHQDFKNQLRELKETFDKSGPSTLLAINTQKKMNAWWNQHIMNMDVELGKHLLNNK